MADGRPAQAEGRYIGREYVVAVWLGSLLDPRDEVVEGLLAHLSVEHAVARPPHRPLHEQMGRARGNRPAPVRLLVAPRHAPISGLVNGEHGHGDPPGQFGEGRVHGPRPRALGRRDATDLGVEFVLGDAEAWIDAVSDLQRARMSYDFPVRGFTCARNVAEVVAGKPLQPQWQVAAHQILEDAVEALAQLRV